MTAAAIWFGIGAVLIISVLLHDGPPQEAMEWRGLVKGFVFWPLLLWAIYQIRR